VTDAAVDPHATRPASAVVISPARMIRATVIGDREEVIGPAYGAAYAGRMVGAGSDRIYTVLPFVVVGMLTAGFVVLFLQRAALRRASVARRIVETDLGAPPRDPRPGPSRPWWGNPWLWLGVCATFIVLGLVVWPGLFGGTFLFLPFVWVWRPRREGKLDPRTNGHARRDGTGTFTGA
jgi:hypothetical protein